MPRLFAVTGIATDSIAFICASVGYGRVGAHSRFENLPRRNAKDMESGADYGRARCPCEVNCRRAHLRSPGSDSILDLTVFTDAPFEVTIPGAASRHAGSIDVHAPSLRDELGRLLVKLEEIFQLHMTQESANGDFLHRKLRH